MSVTFWKRCLLFGKTQLEIQLTLKKWGYDVVRDQLENQLEAGSAPDVARVTNLRWIESVLP